MKWNLRFVRHFSNKYIETEVLLSNGRQIKLSSGKLARLADGNAMVSQGDTSVNVTVVSKLQPVTSNIVPLTVDYQQKSYTAGFIPMNFFRRELGPSESEILTSRLIDRSLRPLFNTNYCYETQIVCKTLAIDNYNLPDVLAVNAASLALSLSDVPWNGPVAAVRVGFVPNNATSTIIINPTRKELQSSLLNLIVTATKHNLVVMLEGSANNILQSDLAMAIKSGVKETQRIIENIEKLQRKFGKKKRLISAVEVPTNYDTVFNAVKTFAENNMRQIFQNYSYDKFARDCALQNLQQETCKKVSESVDGVEDSLTNEIFNQLLRDVFRELIFQTNKRCDGRTLDEIRPISCEVDVFKPLHGSALFQRGQTQVLATVTLDSHESAMQLDQVSMLTSGVKEKNFFLHYEFPPYATNETGRVGAINRRERGHGALAERGLSAVIPTNYPFTIRLNSEVQESNGSSSMASICAGSMALMDAGVPISSAVAGVAMGLVTKPDTVSGFGGIEDYLGDMDFKIAGTRKGFTALQADVKVAGLPLKIVMESIKNAIVAKNSILDKMNKCISSARSDKNDIWPVSETITVDVSKRGRFLGVGGTNLKKLSLETGVQVTHEKDNEYTLFAPNQTAMNEAKEFISKLLDASKIPNFEFGAIYTGKIVEVRDIGVMVELHPEMQPILLHLSHLDTKKVGHPSALGLDVGHEIKVKYFGRDPVSGFIRLSRKVLMS